MRGVVNPLAVVEQAANLISDAVSPRLLPNIELLRYRDTHVLAIRVFPSSNRPHYLGSELETGAYVRVGSTNRRADAELVAEMRRFSRRESFNERPMLELDSEALDFRAASESFAEFRRLTKRDLDILELRTTYHGRSMPTVGGMLLYGCNRLAYFPDAWMQAGKFAGTDRVEIVDQAELKMPTDLPQGKRAPATLIPARVPAVGERRHSAKFWTLYRCPSLVGPSVGPVRLRRSRALSSLRFFCEASPFVANPALGLLRLEIGCTDSAPSHLPKFAWRPSPARKKWYRRTDFA